MQTIIVTGGAGFIGGNFVHHLLTMQDIQVVNLDALTYAGNLDTLQAIMESPRHHFVQGKIQDRELVTDLFERFRPSAIVNFAAESHVDRSIDGPADFIDTNIGGTFNLLECARAYWAEGVQNSVSA
ncbi:MAG: GDP-mannose 4,6-dehydratase [Candidatus Thiodiazotropha sp. (ex Ctena orbiculata)]|nr:GDP-mannose 4,6-dehydratase [Candidatus Thiodiazotropha taylori]MBT2998897.1 GDP-mannose 4,6-dehydratase [Candidatus Thiodiazotropha taylori]MBT3002845.1 GDP-mannose 4,6-dehydratase [Candidatus Thiodiazotropha taylori]MBV2108849.1 GDP-mannose 4,6-dehydratase [Candidatus Thiodiazotropha taylori]MBV2110782.1 GDP-mannose 4,6-dehydratase [Candidatus Thiodiazotropha taylori]